jgi:hypothetical protein
MATKLTHEIRREITIGDEPFTIVISPQGLRLSRKRFRSGRELSWEALWRDGSVERSNGSSPEEAPVPGGTSTV